MRKFVEEEVRNSEIYRFSSVVNFP